MLPLQSELGGNPDYSTHFLRYDSLWLSTIIIMCTYLIDSTSNEYYYIFIAIREILCSQKRQYEPTKAYYPRFEAFISTSDLEKYTAMMHMKLYKTYIEGND